MPTIIIELPDVYMTLLEKATENINRQITEITGKHYNTYTIEEYARAIVVNEIQKGGA